MKQRLLYLHSNPSEAPPTERQSVSRLRRTIEILIVLLVLAVGLALYLHFSSSQKPFASAAANAALVVATALATSLIGSFLTQHLHEREIQRITSDAESRILNGVVRASDRLGLAGFVDRLDYGALLDSLLPGQELLWLDTFVHSYSAFIERLRPAIQRGVRVRMLVIDPDCENCRHRAEEIRHMYGNASDFSAGVRGFVSELQSAAKTLKGAPGSLSARSYSSLPCAPMYIVCQSGMPVSGYSSLFLHRATDGFSHFIWRYRERGFLPLFAEFFEDKWLANEDRDLLAEGAA